MSLETYVSTRYRLTARLFLLDKTDPLYRVRAVDIMNRIIRIERHIRIRDKV